MTAMTPEFWIFSLFLRERRGFLDFCTFVLRVIRRGSHFCVLFFSAKVFITVRLERAYAARVRAKIICEGLSIRTSLSAGTTRACTARSSDVTTYLKHFPFS